MVRQGWSVVLDTPASSPRVIEAASEIAREVGGVLRVVHCAADVETRRARLASRVPLRSQPVEIGPAAGDGRITYEHLPPGTLYLDTAQPIERLVALVLDYLPL